MSREFEQLQQGLEVANDYLAPFAMGAVWMTAIAAQTRLIAEGKDLKKIAALSGGISMLWGYLVRTVVLNEKAILPYAAGSAAGTVIGTYITRGISKNKND